MNECAPSSRNDDGHRTHCPKSAKVAPHCRSIEFVVDEPERAECDCQVSRPPAKLALTRGRSRNGPVLCVTAQRGESSWEVEKHQVEALKFGESCTENDAPLL